MAIPGLRRLSLLIGLVASIAGCAGGHKGTLAGPRPAEVAVVSVSTVEKPPPQTLLDDAFGGEEPRDLLARESVRALKARGYRAATALSKEPIAAPVSDERAAAIAKAVGADATLVVDLSRLEMESLRPLGRMEVDLDLRLVGADGALLWSGAHRGATRVATYQSQNDWRSHLRDALDRALGELP